MKERVQRFYYLISDLLDGGANPDLPTKTNKNTSVQAYSTGDGGEDENYDVGSTVKKGDTPLELANKIGFADYDYRNNTLSTLQKYMRQEAEQWGNLFLKQDHSWVNWIVNRNNSQDRFLIPFEGVQRTYFIEWFYKNSLDHPNSSLIALALRSDDWTLLESKLPVTPYAMRWVIDIAERLKSRWLLDTSVMKKRMKT